MAGAVKRLRPHRAAGWLANPALPVGQIARQSGCPNPQSSTRLFKGECGLPPTHYRAAAQPTDFASPRSAGPRRIEPGAAHALAIRALPAVDVVASEHLGPCMQIGQAIDTRFGRVAALDLLRPGVRMLARCFGGPTAVPETALCAQACIARCGPGEVAAPRLRSTLPAVECALLVHTGLHASIGSAYRWRFGAWLAPSGREPAVATPTRPDKLADPRPHAMKPAPINIVGMKAGHLMRVPAAQRVNGFSRSLRRGRSMDLRALRAALAAVHGTGVCGPIRTGFHMRTPVEAAREAPAIGTPVWRVLDAASPALPKQSFDQAFICVQQALEGRSR